MKAAVLNQVGDDKLELRDDVTTTDPGPDEVKIRVRASGICHSDLSAMNGTLPALAPGIVGHEGAGEETFAEEVVVPRAGVIRVADGVPFDVAALVGCGVMTGVGAVINTAKVNDGKRVLRSGTLVRQVVIFD